MKNKIEGKPTEEVSILGLKAKCTMSPEYTKGTIGMAMNDTSVLISEDTGEQIGEIVACLGGGIQINDKRTSKLYRISPLDLWNAFQAGLDENIPTA